MKAKTRLFGEIEIEDAKVITMEQGIIGFPEYKHFTLIFDAEREVKSSIMWLQSMDDGDIAMPVIEPADLLPDYSPVAEDAQLEALGELTPENICLLVTVTVPEKIENISVNLKAPVIINTDTNKACQIIVEGDYAVRHNIYALIQDGKKKAGE